MTTPIRDALQTLPAIWHPSEARYLHYAHAITIEASFAQELELELRLATLPLELLDEILFHLLELWLVPGKIYLESNGHLGRSEADEQYTVNIRGANLRKPNLTIMSALNKSWLAQAKTMLYYPNIWVLPRGNVASEFFRHWDPTDLQQLSVKLRPNWRDFSWAFLHNSGMSRFTAFESDVQRRAQTRHQFLYGLWACKPVVVNNSIHHEPQGDIALQRLLKICRRRYIKQAFRFSERTTAEAILTI